MSRFALLAPILFSLLAPSHAAAEANREGFQPLEDLPAVRVRYRSPREWFSGVSRGLSKVVRPLRGLVPPTKGEHRMAVVLVEFQDVKRPAFGPTAWEASLFSKGTYTRTPSGDVAYGSMRDYYLENSSGALDITGKVFDWVTLPVRRADIEASTIVDLGSRRKVLNAALDALLAREGRDALKGVHSLAFVVAGDQAKKRGALTWPHSAVVFHGGRGYRYYLMHAGATRFRPIGIHCHEMGHVLGILDKYGVGNGTGLGQWCLMSTGGSGGRSGGLALDAPRATLREKAREVIQDQLKQLGDMIGGGRRTPARAGKASPLHLCSVCKDRLGWTKPRVIDPRQATRIYLTPVEQDASQAARVLLDARGRETLYLEYRAQTGFDSSLPQPGLFVWRVGSPTAMARTFVPFERTELVPAHGVSSIDAPLRAPKLVPFPSGGKTSVEVRGTRRSSWTVRLSGIAIEDGRLYLEIGTARE